MADLLGEFDSHTDVEALKRTLLSTQRELRRARAKVDDLVDATYRAARDALVVESAKSHIPAPAPDKRSKGAEVALWHMTDWQGAKVTTSYNREVMRRRVHAFVDKALRITEIQRADHPVKDVAILFGGDLVEGLFNFPTQPFEIDATIFEQWTSVSRLIIEVVQRALAAHAHVTVVSEWGNHGRIGSKRSAVPRSDNIDRMCYETARMAFGGEKRLTWPDCPEDIQRVEIGNYRALLMHADEIGRNGFASPMTIVAHINRLRSGAYRWEGWNGDTYLGHYHTHAEWPLANGVGSVYQTGSTESDNRYARDMLASSATPSQRLHFIDPEKGRVTAQYKVHLGDTA